MDIVTFVDHECEQMFRDNLSEKFPGDAVMGEESFDPNHNYRQHEKLWIIDPLDGTLMYQRGIPLYAPMIAYVENGEIQCSAIFFPEMNELYYADHDRAYRNNVKIHVSQIKNISEGVFRISQNMLKRPIPDLLKKEQFSQSI